MTTSANAPSTSNSNNSGSAATATSGGSLPTPRRQVHFSSTTQTNTNTRQSKKELEKLRKKKESLYGIEAAERLRKEGIFTDLATHLESLPKQIATAIVDKAYAMLDLVTEIQTKSTQRRGGRIRPQVLPQSHEESCERLQSHQGIG